MQLKLPPVLLSAGPAAIPKRRAIAPIDASPELFCAIAIAGVV